MPDDLRADEQADADHAADVAEQAGARHAACRARRVEISGPKQPIVNSPAAIAIDEEQDRGVMDDERPARLHVEPDLRGSGCSTMPAGAQQRRRPDDQRPRRSGTADTRKLTTSIA